MGNKRSSLKNVITKPTCLDQLQPSVQVKNSIDRAAHLYCFRNFGALGFHVESFCSLSTKASKPHMTLTA
uniref:Uncharacterized protein n=1 Tax=Arundo donax TaxID=35708 RepID=A0A0A9DW01_ARUDO